MRRFRLAWFLAAVGLVVVLPALVTAQPSLPDTLTLHAGDGRLVSGTFVPEEVLAIYNGCFLRVVLMELNGQGLDAAVAQLGQWVRHATPVDVDAKSAQGRFVLLRGLPGLPPIIVESFTLRYTMFLPDGKPIRATVSVTLVELDDVCRRHHPRIERHVPPAVHH